MEAFILGTLLGVREAKLILQGVNTLYVVVDPIKADDMQITGFVHVTRDITEMRQAEIILKRSLDQINLLLNASSYILYQCEAFGDFDATYISDNIEPILGYKPDEFLQKGFWASQIHPEDAPRVFKELNQLFEHGIHKHEYRFRHKDGSWRWIYDELRLNRDEKGNPKDILGCIVDVTERKQAEEALRKEKAFSETAINSLPGIFYLFDEKGRFLRWNLNAIVATGYSGEEMSRMHPPDFFTGEGKEKVGAAIQEVFEKGEAWVEADLISKDGSQTPYLFTGRLFYSENQKYLAGMGIDISERKRVEEDRERLIQEMKLALEKVKTLSGMLPICASCKKIRDDKGYWTQIESYIRAHSEVEFSHGICPECMKKLYPDDYDDGS